MIETGTDYRNDGNGDNQTGCFRGIRHGWDLEEEEEGRIITSTSRKEGGKQAAEDIPGLVAYGFWR